MLPLYMLPLKTMFSPPQPFQPSLPLQTLYSLHNLRLRLPHNPPPIIHHSSQSTKTRPHQIQQTARTPSLERLTPESLFRTLYLPSDPAAELAPRSSRRQAKAVNRDNQEPIEDQCRKAMALCTAGLESVTDYQLRNLLKPLLDFDRINQKKICNPLNFSSVAMVTTFVRSAGDRTRGVGKFLNTVCQTDLGMKFAELDHSSLKKCLPFCSERVPILVHPPFIGP